MGNIFFFLPIWIFTKSIPATQNYQSKNSPATGLLNFESSMVLWAGPNHMISQAFHDIQAGCSLPLVDDKNVKKIKWKPCACNMVGAHLKSQCPCGQTEKENKSISMICLTGNHVNTLLHCSLSCVLSSGLGSDLHSKTPSFRKETSS